VFLECNGAPGCDPAQRPSDRFTTDATVFFWDGAAAFIFGTGFFGFFVSRLPRCFSMLMGPSSGA
jgi:hypothetical protein